MAPTPDLLAAAPLESPLFWAAFIVWMMTVVLHEFAHGVVAYLGGDYTIKERGGLTLNPVQYIDPVMSLLLPAVFLLMGGVPLPGGVTYIRRDLLRSRAWESAVAAAGPLMNVLLFFALVLPLHPAVGWLNPSNVPAGASETATNLQRLLGAMAVLQMIAVVLNLIPVPPLDGFQMLGPHLDPATRERLSTPPLSTALFVVFFIFVWKIGVSNQAFNVAQYLLRVLGFDGWTIDFIRRSFNFVVLGTDE